MTKELRLSEASIGRTYQVERIEGSGFIRRRIIDMGLVPGTEVKIVGTAPLGDPINLVARGYNLTIRKNEASMVIVRVVDE
ncbi:MAG: FeoA family protein [Candidatus Asgardarchaeia archaeon]